MAGEMMCLSTRAGRDAGDEQANDSSVLAGGREGEQGCAEDAEDGRERGAALSVVRARAPEAGMLRAR
jgi:hypothetical protein